MNTPTPRTDAETYGVEGTAEGSTEEYKVGPRLIHVSADFARTLERELIETERLRFGADADRRQLRVELDRERAKVRTLREALLRIAYVNGCGVPKYTTDAEQARAALAATEDKP